MLHEVRETLHTVTERLQQILKTVRRDPTRSESTPIDLNEIVAEMEASWGPMAADKWKLHLRVERGQEPLVVLADRSHLIQALENLIFNARDAIFEMRGRRREQARTEPSLSEEQRRQAIIAAAGWRGTVVLRARRDKDWGVIEVSDDGIGMTPEVRDSCLETHFSTKRDNALYEGNSTGMGLGLPFVQAILEHHRGRLQIESEPLQGTSIRLFLPLQGDKDKE